MTQRDIPDGWPPAGAGEPDKMEGSSRTPQFGDSPAFGVPATGSTSKSVKQRKENNPEGVPQSEETIVRGRVSKKLTHWIKSYVFWSVLLTLMPGNVALLAMAILLKLPSAPK